MLWLGLSRLLGRTKRASIQRTPSLDIVVRCTQALLITLFEITCGRLITLLSVMLNLRMQGKLALLLKHASVTAPTCGILVLTTPCVWVERTPDGGMQIELRVPGSILLRKVTSLLSVVMSALPPP